MTSLEQLQRAAEQAWQDAHEDYYEAVAVLVEAGWSETGAARAVADLERACREQREPAAA